MPLQGLTRFPGQVVLVTGAASGIGKATARRFVQEGATVIFADKQEESLHEAMDRLEPAQAIPSITDVSISEQVQTMISMVNERFGRLDVLVNNAGTTALGTVLDSPWAEWERVCATTLSGTVDVSRTALPYLIESKGCIVNTASVSGIGGDWNTPYYDAAKGGVVSLTRAMALDHGRDGVRINAICPSVTRSEMTKDMLDNEPYLQSLRDRVALGWMGEPEDMAAAILFLASADAAYITGLIMPVDGGTTASNGQPPFPTT
ncbi:meso-2,3-butanediol dehydrogenase [Gluconobacter morbifer]|uniref:Ketoreductase domain-containing protein n=1 Tax=Gluconobacter morbifer G707 TaxID=1088869 RepID=G6XJN4_9PROT|nr:SDR family oxidoreductase [Gluconobacter morbifer]EHH67846.1 hypothetical protein GMO_16130 [Gluconobacter morbifer G707]